MQLQSSLRSGEELLWCGRPDPSVVFVAADVIAARSASSTPAARR
jgi:hypothetical protein